MKTPELETSSHLGDCYFLDLQNNNAKNLMVKAFHSISNMAREISNHMNGEKVAANSFHNVWKNKD